MATVDPALEQATCSQPQPISFVVRAYYLGERIDLRSYSPSPRVLAQQPVTLPIDGGGTAVLFRFGAAVFFDGTDDTRGQFLRNALPFVEDRYDRPQSEEVSVSVSPDRREAVEAGTVILRDGTMERLHVVAAVLAKSVALAQYETDVTAAFERIEPFAVDLERGRRGGQSMRRLLRHIGQALLNEHKMVARVEVTDRPELLWEHPELNQLYLRLEDEFELQERAAILDRKLELISRTVETVLDLVQKDRSTRVEWYIVILIVIEIVLSVYGLVAR